jgi:Plants and Prokaryotes Conserved (PCC) domain
MTPGARSAGAEVLGKRVAGDVSFSAGARGSEGTCVTVLETTVRLMAAPRARALLVLGFRDIDAACRARCARICSVTAIGGADLAARAPRIVNALASVRPAARLLQSLAGIAPDRRPPRLASETFQAWWRRRPPRSDGRPLILWFDTLTNYFHPEVGSRGRECARASRLPRRGASVDVLWPSLVRFRASRPRARIPRRRVRDTRRHRDRPVFNRRAGTELLRGVPRRSGRVGRRQADCEDRRRSDGTVHELREQVEVLSLMGDITCEGDKHNVHAHVVIGKADATAHGGHLFAGHVRPTLEIVMTELPAHLHRRFDPKTGLNLIGS